MQIRIDCPDKHIRTILKQLLLAGLDAADPESAIQRAVRIKNNSLRVGTQEYDLAGFSRIVCIGAGKPRGPWRRRWNDNSGLGWKVALWWSTMAMQGNRKGYDCLRRGIRFPIIAVKSRAKDHAASWIADGPRSGLDGAVRRSVESFGSPGRRPDLEGETNSPPGYCSKWEATIQKNHEQARIRDQGRPPGRCHDGHGSLRSFFRTCRVMIWRRSVRAHGPGSLDVFRCEKSARHVRHPEPRSLSRSTTCGSRSTRTHTRDTQTR